MKNASKFEILIHKAWENPEFRKMLKEHPEKALFSLGIETPRGKKIKVYEDTETQIHISIPHAPPELSEEDLKKLSAGGAVEVLEDIAKYTSIGILVVGSVGFTLMAQNISQGNF
jgi:hypothetical protein